MELLTQLGPQWQEGKCYDACLYLVCLIVALEKGSGCLARGIICRLTTSVYSLLGLFGGCKEVSSELWTETNPVTLCGRGHGDALSDMVVQVSLSQTHLPLDFSVTASRRQRTGERACSLIVLLIFIFGNGLLIFFLKLERLMLTVCAEETMMRVPRTPRRTRTRVRLPVCVSCKDLKVEISWTYPDVEKDTVKSFEAKQNSFPWLPPGAAQKALKWPERLNFRTLWSSNNINKYPPMKETHEVCAYIWPVFPSSPYWGSQFPGLDRVTFHPSGVAEVREFSVVLRPGVHCHMGSDAKTTKLQFSKPSCFKKKIKIITKEKLPSLIFLPESLYSVNWKGWRRRTLLWTLAFV